MQSAENQRQRENPESNQRKRMGEKMTRNPYKTMIQLRMLISGKD